MAWRMSVVRDISHHQGTLNYGEFKRYASDVQIKITESTTFIDNMGATYFNNLVGMRRAPYHFARPVSFSGQIAHFLRRKVQIGQWERPDMLDCEFSGITGEFIRLLVAEYRKQSGIRQVQVYVGLHDILTSCPPSQWWDEDIYMQVARYRKIGGPENPDAWRTHLGFDHPGLSTYQWDNAQPFYPGGPIGDISYDRVFVTFGGDEMAITDEDLKKLWGAPNGGGFYEGLRNLFVDAATQNPEGGYADQIRDAVRSIVSGVPTTLTESDRNAIIQGVTTNLISHFQEHPPTFTVDVDNAAIAAAVLNGMSGRLES